MLVLVDTSSSMNTKDKRNAESIEDAARALGEIKADQNFDISQANEIQTKIASPSRIELAKATLKNNDLVTIPKGYHPVVAGHGYNIYYLNFLAGSDQSLANSDDPDHKWIYQSWKRKDPRVPIVKAKKNEKY